MAVVKLNNDLRELAIKEGEEIERILAELSAQAAGYLEELTENINILSHLDFVFAKAMLSVLIMGLNRFSMKMDTLI